MPVTEKPEPEFEMDRPVFHRPATDADIERPATPPVATTLPDVTAGDVETLDREPARRRAVRGRALPERSNAQAVEEPAVRTVEPEPQPVVPEPVPTIVEDAKDHVPVSQPEAQALETASEVPVQQREEQMAMNVPQPSPAEAPSAKNTLSKLKVLSKGRLPQMPNAFYNGTEGWVRLEFSLDSSGKPVAIHVLESQPKRVFNRVAMKYLRSWRYQVDGLSEAALNERRNVKVVFKH